MGGSIGHAMELSTIIVNWNSRDYLRGCLRSMGERYWTGHNEVVVIDSGSFDGCGEMLAAEFPQVRFIQSSENLGFARANNEAFRSSQGRYVLFLNPDIEVLGDAIERLLETIRKVPKAGCVGCVLLNSDSSIQTSCIQALPTILNQVADAEWLRKITPASVMWGTRALLERGNAPREVEVISGACIMMRREVFEEVGMFSEDYFMYVEDVDLSEKMLKLGYRNILEPGARMVHHGGSSSQGAKGQFAAVMMREAIWSFLRKKHGDRYAGGYRAAMAAAALIRTGLLFLLGPSLLIPSTSKKWKSAWGKWQAILEWSVSRQRSLARLR